MKSFRKPRVLFREKIADTARADDGRISWQVLDEVRQKKMQHLGRTAKEMQSLLGTQVAALESTGGQDLELMLVVELDTPLPLSPEGSSNPMSEIITAALHTIMRVAESPAPGAVISIEPGDPADSSDTKIFVPGKVAQLANVIRQHMPPDGMNLQPATPAASDEVRLIPKRGCSQPILDEERVPVSGEILRVCDESRQILLRGEQRKLLLSYVPESKIREQFLLAQLQGHTVHLLVAMTHRMEDGVRKNLGGVIAELISISENPSQRELL